MKSQAYKKRSDRVFQVGDMVFMKLQPYVQSSMAPHAHHKLLFKFYGPFRILERIGESAYRLQLPPNSRIHPVLHVSQLKQALGVNCQVQPELPSPDAQFAVPVRILQRRFRQDGASSIPQGLVQWSDQPETLSTWKDLVELKQRFPLAPAWGLASSQGRGSVSSPTTPAAADRSTTGEEAQRAKRATRPSSRYPLGEWVSK